MPTSHPPHNSVWAAVNWTNPSMQVIPIKLWKDVKYQNDSSTWGVFLEGPQVQTQCQSWWSCEEVAVNDFFSQLKWLWVVNGWVTRSAQLPYYCCPVSEWALHADVNAEYVGERERDWDMGRKRERGRRWWWWGEWAAGGLFVCDRA